MDIGCGRGAALFALAEPVGPTGQVTGFDLSAGMIAQTRSEVAARGLRNVELYVTDAMSPQLPTGRYDVAAASLVAFFLPDPAAGLRTWRELLAPGGRLGLTTFGARDDAWLALDDIFTPFLPPQLLDARTSGAAGPFASDGGMAWLLGAAGFSDVRTIGFDVEAVFADTEHWRAWSCSHGQRAMWEAVPESELGAVRAAAGAQLEALAGPDGSIRLQQSIRLTVAAR